MSKIHEVGDVVTAPTFGLYVAAKSPNPAVCSGCAGESKAELCNRLPHCVSADGETSIIFVKKEPS